MVGIQAKMEGQRVRGRNFSEGEKRMLLELVTGKFKPYVENKQTDAVTIAKKNLAWQELAKEFNRQNHTGQRTAKQLHVLYDNLKKAARSNILSDKQNAYKAGGGRFTPKSSDLDFKIVTMLQDQCQPQPNKYYSSTTFIDAQGSSSHSAPVKLENNSLQEEDMLLEFKDSTINEPNTEYLQEATTTEQGSAENENYCLQEEEMLIEFKDSTINEPNTEYLHEATTEQGSAENSSPSLTPVPEDNLRARRQRKCSNQASKTRKQSIETLSNRFVQRKNFKDHHDNEIHAKKLEILEIEKEIKLKQLAIVQQQLELEKLNFTNRLEEIERERKICDIKMKKMLSNN